MRRAARLLEHRDFDGLKPVGTNWFVPTALISMPCKHRTLGVGERFAAYKLHKLNKPYKPINSSTHLQLNNRGAEPCVPYVSFAF
jgi:hypothetical protein